MTPLEVIDIARDTVFTLLIIAAPMMIAGLLVGVVVALFQALTQIQEMTLVFVPKIVAIFLTLFFSMSFLGDVMSGYMNRMVERIIAG